MYFFVSPDNTKLAKQIEVGFEQAIKDGSFDQLFFNNSMIKNALQKAKLNRRRVFHLKNPNMALEALTDRKKYWLDLEGLVWDQGNLKELQ